MLLWCALACCDVHCVLFALCLLVCLEFVVWCADPHEFVEVVVVSVPGVVALASFVNASLTCSVSPFAYAVGSGLDLLPELWPVGG